MKETKAKTSVEEEEVPAQEPVTLDELLANRTRRERPQADIDALMKDLKFEPPGSQRRLKNIFTVKAFDPEGNLVQLPLADQINNNVAGSDQLIGLRHYVRKGFTVLWDFDQNRGAYCPMGDCFAEWNDAYRGYCCADHMQTMDVKENPGAFGRGATTSRTWTKS